jgi:hypothetical protein
MLKEINLARAVHVLKLLATHLPGSRWKNEIYQCKACTRIACNASAKTPLERTNLASVVCVLTLLAMHCQEATKKKQPCQRNSCTKIACTVSAKKPPLKGLFKAFQRPLKGLKELTASARKPQC